TTGGQRGFSLKLSSGLGRSPYGAKANLARSRVERGIPVVIQAPTRPPSIAALEPGRSIQLDLDVHARRQLQAHQGIDRLVGRVDDVHEPLVGAQLELIAGVLVGVRGDQERKAL